MLVLLPAIFFCATSVMIIRQFKTGRRISVLVSALITGALITFITELFSLFHCLGPFQTALAWLAATIFPLVMALPDLKKISREKYWDGNSLFYDERFLLVLIEAALIITVITAVFSAPNAWDSMTYHLSRVEHWLQDRTVSYYPTNDIRQLYYCPWAEFAIAQLRLLCPWEPIVNLLQWFAMAGSLIAVSLITQQMGGSRRSQLIACFSAVILPMGILESVSTQNDYVETFWLLCFICFANEMRRHYKSLFIFSAGAGLGLALLTKGYGYVLMIPFLVYLLASMTGVSKKIKTAFIIIICVLVLNAGYYTRNQSAFGSLTAAKEDLATSSPGLKVLAGNLMRNFGVEMDTPSKKVNYTLAMGLSKISTWLGIDFYYDPQASLNPFFVKGYHMNECYSGNFLHMILFALVFILCCFKPPQGQGVRLYAFLICCAGILFCWSIRYQHWVTRFHLPLFIMFCPVFGVFMDRVLSPRKLILLGALFFLFSFPFLFFDFYHPWFGETSIWQIPYNKQYYISRPVVHNYMGMARQIRSLGCQQVGIISNSDSWEYPLWTLLKKQGAGGPLRIEHLDVKNDSSHIPYPLGRFDPCAIVTIEDKPKGMALSDKHYKMIWEYQNPEGYKTTVYVPRT